MTPELICNELRLVAPDCNAGKHIRFPLALPIPQQPTAVSTARDSTASSSPSEVTQHGTISTQRPRGFEVYELTCNACRQSVVSVDAVRENAGQCPRCDARLEIRWRMNDAAA